MTAMVCPFCETYATFTTKWNSGNIAQGETNGLEAAIQCHNPNCRRVLGAVVRNGKTSEVFDYWPRHVGGKEFPDVPEHIASTADEAHRCMSIGAHRGAVALARAVVEATAKAHGFEKGTLEKKIKDLADNDVISPAMKDAADEIRFAGNEVAHADLAEESMDPDDAAEILDLMNAILLRVYQEPRQVERVRENRKKRRGEG
jgi:hypothetical protein